MILAAPLVIPFAKAVGLSVGTLGMAALADKVNEYIQDNPEESMKILSTIIPSIGIGQISMSKEKISLEDLDEMTDEEAQDLTKEEKAELMKQAGKSGGKNKRQTMIDISEKLGLSGPGREKQDIEYEVDERYDEGGVEDAPKPKFDYKRFFRKADGGAIGVESLFEEKKKKGGRVGYSQGGSRRSKYDSTGGGLASSSKSKNISPGPGGGGGETTTVTPTKKPLVTSTKNPFNKKNLQAHFANNQLLADAVKKGILTNKEYNILGGYDATQTLGLGPLDTGLASLSYNVAQSVLGNQPFSDIPGDVARNVKGATNISPELKAKYENIIRQNQNLAEGGRVGFNVGGITDPAALSIYNSMSAYGFSDQEIADAITAQGYDAGTLGQTTTPDTPTAPTPGEGIIGIDLQQRDTGGGFNPFGPLQSTFTKDLSEVAGFDYLTPTQQMNKYKAQTQDNMFGLGRFFQPKIRGTLGNRLQKQFELGQKLPSPLAQIAGTRSPFNIDSKNYNPDFVDQLNYLEGMEGLIGMSSVGLKYGPESVLFGKNVISGFGTNNYQKALEKFIAKARGDRKIKAQTELDNFLAAEKARKEKEDRERQDILEAAIRTRRDSGESLSDIGRDMFTGPGKAFEKRSGGFSVDSSGNRRNYGGR